jgi:hypothetical protein
LLPPSSEFEERNFMAPLNNPLRADEVEAANVVPVDRLGGS